MIRNHLSAILGEKRLKIPTVAQETGLSCTGLRNLYHEKPNGIKFETLDALCQYLGCSVGDLLEYIGLNASRCMPDLRKTRRKLSTCERRVLKALKEKSCFPDDIIRETGLPADRVMTVLLDLELNGLVSQTSANYYTAL